jgi:hypothetical protein
MQICLLIFAPVFFSACNYIYLPRLLEVTGVRYSSVTPKSMAGTFIVGDILCIAVQGFGGGVAGGGDDRMMFKAGMIGESLSEDWTWADRSDGSRDRRAT